MASRVWRGIDPREVGLVHFRERDHENRVHEPRHGESLRAVGGPRLKRTRPAAKWSRVSITRRRRHHGTRSPGDRAHRGAQAMAPASSSSSVSSRVCGLGVPTDSRIAVSRALDGKNTAASTPPTAKISADVMNTTVYP